jgi:hypothetical protein
MEEFRPEDFEEELISRPRWQVWGARIVLILLLVAIGLYYWSIAHPF